MSKHETTALPSICRIFRYTEWTVLGVTLLIVLLDRDSKYWLILPTWVTFVFLGVFALLSLIFPINRSLWKRRSYVLLEILLVVSTPLTGISFDVLLYVFIAKSCFLLARRDLAIAVFTTGIAWNLIFIWLVPKELDFTKAHPEYWSNINRVVLSTIINGTGVYLAASTFAILLSFAVMAEHRSRQKAEFLAKEVEVLAANLERTRIARDIHDSLGHTLTNLQVQLAVAQKLRQHKPDRAFQAVDTAKLLADQCIEDISHALQTIRKSDFDLNQALRTLVEQVRQNDAWSVSWEIDLPPLPLSTSHHIHCIVKEGLINVQKHACASRVRLQAQSTHDEIILELEDDGRGFDLRVPHSGLGLKGMAERVQVLQGKLTINSTPGLGTHIQVRLPL